jgi:hypothetical protein
MRPKATNSDILRQACALANVYQSPDNHGAPKLRNFWLVSFTRLCGSMALLSAVDPALASQGTLEQRMACTPDVFRLCSAFIPNADEITICLIQKIADLSDACRSALAAGLNQPSTTDGTAQSRKRISQ